MTRTKNQGLSEAGAQKAWTRLFPIARMVFHAALVLYVLSQFARAVCIPAGYGGIVHVAATAIQDGVRVALLALGLAECLRNWRRGAVKVALLGVAWLASAQSSNYNNIYDYIGFLLLSDLAEEKGTVRLNLFAHGLMALVLVWMTAYGMELFRGKWGHSLGMSNINSTAAMILGILTLVWAAGLRKHPVLSCLVFWAGALVSEFLTTCHTVTVLLAVFPLLALLTERIGKSKYGGVTKALIGLPGLLAAASIGVMLWLASRESMPAVGGFFENFAVRFTHAARYFRENGLSLFGAPMDTYTTDNLYLNALLNHGIAGLLLVAGGMTWSTVRLYRRRRFDLMALQTVLALYGVMEVCPITIVYSFLPTVVMAVKPEEATAPAAEAAPMRSLRKQKLILTAALAVIFGALALLLPEVNVARQYKTLNRSRTSEAGAAFDGDTALYQTFRAGSGRFSGISFGVATYESGPSGSLTVVLESKKGEELERAQVSFSGLQGSELTALFRNVYPKGNYRVRIENVALTGGKLAALESTGNAYRHGALLADGEETDRDLMLRVVSKQSRGRLTRIAAEAGTWALLAAALWFFLPGAVPVTENAGKRREKLKAPQGEYIRLKHGEDSAAAGEPGAKAAPMPFGWALALTLAVYAALAGIFYWILGDDWSRTMIVSDPVNKLALLPEMDGTAEIRQTLRVAPDELHSLTLGINVSPEADENGELRIRLEEGGETRAEWTCRAATLSAGEDLTLRAEPHLQGVAGHEMTLVLEGKDAAAFWYGNTRSAGKFEVAVESAGVLTVNGSPVEGELVIRQSGYRSMQYMRWFWPCVLLGGLLLGTGTVYAHSRRVRGKRFFLNELIDEVRRYWYLLKMLVIRDFNVKYRSSVLGVLWSFLNPLLMTLVYMFVFSTIFQNSIQNFIVYVMSGIVLFNYLSDASNLCMQSIVGNAGLITKVYMPKYIFPVSKAISSAINLVISMIPLLLIMLLTGVPFSRSLLLIPLVMLFLVTFCVGLGLMLSSALVFFRDVQFLWSILLMIWNFLSPLFYPESIIPARFLTLYHLNPMYQYMYFMRTITLGGVSPLPNTYVYCALSSLAVLALGIWVFRKHQDQFVLHL